MKRQALEIVGGGVAGLSLGVGLRKAGIPVVLREASRYPRHRLCGEFVNGVSQQTLARLGIEDLFEDALQHDDMTWWRGSGQIASSRLAKPVAALSRWQMDLRMSSRFQELGGELHCQARVPLRAVEGRVWAAGRKLARESEWLGLKAHFLGLETCSGLEMHLGEYGYVGLTPVEEGRVNVCGLFQKRSDLPGRGKEKLLSYLRASSLDDLVSRLEDAKMDEVSLTGVSGLSFGAQNQEEDLVTVGDAERMIPPFTGNGMSMAFEAAECALQPLISYSQGDASWAEAHLAIRKLLQNRFRRRIALAKGLHPFLLQPQRQGMLAALAKPSLLPFTTLTRLLT